MRAGHGSTPHLFDAWGRARRILRRSSYVALFLDFDGTLVRLRRNPDEARLSDMTRRVLRRLARNPRAGVWVVSGRRRDELRKRLRLDEVRYLGLYGWENGVRLSLPVAVRNSLRRARIELSERLSRYPSVLIEDKKLSITIHHPSQSAHTPHDPIASVVQEISGHSQKHLKLIENLRGWELIPLACPGKGIGVVKELAKCAPRNALPVYFGDDLSDEPAFTALPRGLTVLVGDPRKTRARFRLRSPQEVSQALYRLEEELA